MGATLIDGVLVGIVAGIILAAAGISPVGRFFLEGLIQAVYQVVMLGAFAGRTIGNRVVSTQTVDGRTGIPIGYDKAFPRAAVQLVLNYTGIGGLVDVLWPLWDKQNQTLHDKAAGTVVLRTDISA